MSYIRIQRFRTDLHGQLVSGFMALERFRQFEDSSSQVNEQRGRLTSRTPIVSRA
jgi:hypothetical protein